MKNKFSWRAFISIGLLYSFIIIFVTGIILYLSPQGRIAHWINWKLLGFTKENWQAIHTIFAYVFAILSIFHLFTINWKAFWSYLTTKSKQGLNKKKEFYLSTLLTIFIFLGVTFSVPPFSSIMDFGEYLTKSWDNENTAPPIPHAELLTLTELSKKIDNITIEQIKNRLKANEVKFNNVNETLEAIGKLNNITPSKIYNIIIQKTTSNIRGSGMGKKSLKQFADENNKDLQNLLKILKDNNINATGEQTLRNIASENDMAAKDIFKLIK